VGPLTVGGELDKLAFEPYSGYVLTRFDGTTLRV